MSNRVDDEVGSVILFDSVRAAIRLHGGDTTEAPFDRLDAPSKAVWLTAWRALIEELLRRDYIFAQYTMVRQMTEGDPMAALWRSLEKGQHGE